MHISYNILIISLYILTLLLRVCDLQIDTISRNHRNQIPCVHSHTFIQVASFVERIYVQNIYVQEFKWHSSPKRREAAVWAHTIYVND